MKFYSNYSFFIIWNCIQIIVFYNLKLYSNYSFFIHKKQNNLARTWQETSDIKICINFSWTLCLKVAIFFIMAHEDNCIRHSHCTFVTSNSFAYLKYLTKRNVLAKKYYCLFIKPNIDTICISRGQRLFFVSCSFIAHVTKLLYSLPQG